MKVYLDHAATTALEERALEKMIPYMTQKFGNASSLHSFGREATTAVDDARERIASLLGCASGEIYFTSGGTESDNWALFGVVSACIKDKKHIVTTAIEHPAVLSTCKELEKRGVEVTYIGVDESGIVKTEDVIRAVRDDTVLISVMYANNEIGTIQPISEIGRFCREKGIYFHTDAVQAIGSVKIDVQKDNVDLLSFSSHKFYGPKGIGVLYVRKGVSIDKLIFGGEQERNKRAGTTNTPGIVGTAEALSLAYSEAEKNNAFVRSLRDRFIERVEREIPCCRLNGDITDRLPGNANFCFDHVPAESVLMALDRKGIAVSSGSACSSGSLEPSHVLTAIGKTPEEARSSVRFSFGKDNTYEEVDYVADVLKETVEKIRNWTPLYKPLESKGYKV